MSVLLEAANNAAVVVRFSQTDLIILAGVLIFFALIVLVLLKRFVVNSILGIVAIIILNSAGIGIPLNLPNLLVSAILGLVGIALLVILKLSGITL